MSGNILHDAGMIGSGVTVTSGAMMWLGEHASAIGALVSIISLILTFVFLFLNYKLNVKRLDFDRRHLERRKAEEE